MTRVSQLSPDIHLDARRAVWFPKASILAVADLHLGYAWGERQRGFLLPLAAADDPLGRLSALQREYEPAHIVCLGDILHRALPLPSIQEELVQFVEELGTRSTLIFIKGNHDRDLEKLLDTCGLKVRLERQVSAGPYEFVHGDETQPGEVARMLEQVRVSQGRIFMGHEHPAVTVGDGFATSIKCPCFLVSNEVVVLPAFSHWAAGSDIARGSFMSPLARNARMTRAFAVMGENLLPMSIAV